MYSQTSSSVQSDSGNMRIDSPELRRVLNRFQNSGRRVDCFRLETGEMGREAARSLACGCILPDCGLWHRKFTFQEVSARRAQPASGHDVEEAARQKLLDHGSRKRCAALNDASDISKPKEPLVVSVFHVDQLNFTYAPWSCVSWNEGEAKSTFSRERKENPSLWNGQVLLLRNARFAHRTLSGAFFENRLRQSFGRTRPACLARHALRPARFPGAAIFGSDGGLILGEVAAHTRYA